MRCLHVVAVVMVSGMLAGCAAVEKNWESARTVTGNARAQEISLYSAPAEAVPISLAVEEYLSRALDRDPEAASLDMEAEHNRLQVEGARSLTAPRFSLRSSVDVPLDAGRGLEDREVNGGLHVDYDLVRAMFADAESAVAEARLRQTQVQKHRHVRELEWGLVRLLLKRQRALESARIAGDAALVASLAREGLESLHGGNGAETWRWRSELDSRQAAERVARAEAERTGREMNRRLGLSEGAVITIVGLDALLARVDVARDRIADLPEMVKQAMEREERLQVAETQLFLAGMAVEKARRSRWPSVSIGIGLGEFYLQSRDDTAHVIGQLQFSYPLWDAGDRRREIQAAELQRSRAESSVRETSAAVATEVGGAWREWALVRDELLAAEQWLETVDGRIGLVAGDAGVSETAELRMLRLSAEARVLDSRFRAREATVALLQVSGASLDVLGPETGAGMHDDGR